MINSLSTETIITLIVSGLTNFAMFPAIVQLHHQRRPFVMFIGVFTMITSFFYHVCDSIDGPIWLTEGQWHRLDNIGSIMSFVCWLFYLMDIKDEYTHQCCVYAMFGLTLLMQEYAPWDELFSGIPIFASVGLLLLRLLTSPTPPYNYTELYRGLFFLGLGVVCFIRGLDDDTDPFRVFHGLWHANVSAAAYFNFRVLPIKKKVH